jgi:hypothetical protein
MDLLELIKEKCDSFSDTDIIESHRNVITHIEVAEQHFHKGKMGDECLFTDVIYRCNQAFEGSIKEAYKVFTGKNTENRSVNSIEHYFEEEGILRNRVLSLFTNYRQQWRNESTHNYNLNFTSQEAFLALVNICAFFNILLDEMLIKKAYNKQKEEFSISNEALSLFFEETTLIGEVTQILLEFSKNIHSGETINRSYMEMELIGSLSAYVSLVDKSLEATSGYSIIDDNFIGMPDIFIQKNKDTLLVEMKRLGSNIPFYREEAKMQLLRYMHASGINAGIVYIPPIKPSDKMVVNEVEGLDSNLKVVEIYPE